ncbi:MAG: hypothetical protein KGZ83_10650 [Sulfuricella sp.]|nr:hypothetical protein [Sulfuricella sp.]
MDICDVMIHFDASLSESRRAGLEETIRGQNGVIAARFNPGREHLLVVAFDPVQVRAAALLAEARGAGYTAQLVGG